MLGFYFVFFPRNTVRMLAFLPPFLMQVFQIPARFVLGMYLLVDNLVPFLFAGEGGVAHGAHIGGFIVGGIVAWVMDRRGHRGPPVGHRGAGERADGRRRGSRRPSRTAAPTMPLEPTSPCPPSSPGARSPRARRWIWPPGCGSRGTRTPRSPSCARWCATCRGARASPRSTRSPAMILLDDRREPTAAYQYLLAALEMGPRPETVDTVRRSLAAIEGLQKRRIGRLHSAPRG